jgi:hypothetical protein
VGVEWNVRGALEVVGVLVVAHFFFGRCWSFSGNDDRWSLW